MTTHDLLRHLTDTERARLDELLRSGDVWQPLPGPQSMAYQSPAQVVGFGGAAGGGKTDLAVGLALTQHRRIGIFRQNGTELVGVVDRIAELIGSREGFNGSDRIWRWARRDGVEVQIELGSFPQPGDVEKYRGRPHDLLVFDEASSMRAQDVRFIMGWLRTTEQGQRCRALMTFNPPTRPEGRWVIDYFRPWLDKTHPNPAKPGELRWFATIDGKEAEVRSGAVIEHKGERIQPQSRTFVPSRITDNPYLLNTGYMATLQALEEPFRSQMLYGDFNAGVEDDPFQVIPTRWVEAAMARWRPLDAPPPMDSVGVDVARGGKDKTVIARRHGNWFAEPLVYPGASTPDGPTVAGLVISATRDRAPIHIDAIGVGASPYDFLVQAQQQVLGINVAEAAHGTDRSGRIKFRNLRSEVWWRMREALDPQNGTGLALPPDSRLLSDLTCATWTMSGSTIMVASRDAIIQAIGRSPDYASAFCLAMIETPKQHAIDAAFGRSKRGGDYDPYAGLRRDRNGDD